MAEEGGQEGGLGGAGGRRGVAGSGVFVAVDPSWVGGLWEDLGEGGLTVQRRAASQGREALGRAEWRVES